jgi:undecaprenyl-diphosphatase
MQRGQGWKKAAIALVAFALVIACTDQLCGSVLRPFFHRYRPSQVQSGISSLLHLIDVTKGVNTDFPHAMQPILLDWILFSFVFQKPDIKYFHYGMGVLVSYSRIYMGVHYPSDIVVGMLVGFAVSTLIYFTLKWLYASRLQIAAQYNIIHPCCTQQHMLLLSFEA